MCVCRSLGRKGSKAIPLASGTSASAVVPAYNRKCIGQHAEPHTTSKPTPRSDTRPGARDRPRRPRPLPGTSVRRARARPDALLGHPTLGSSLPPRYAAGPSPPDTQRRGRYRAPWWRPASRSPTAPRRRRVWQQGVPVPATRAHKHTGQASGRRRGGVGRRAGPGATRSTASGGRRAGGHAPARPSVDGPHERPRRRCLVRRLPCGLCVQTGPARGPHSPTPERGASPPSGLMDGRPGRGGGPPARAPEGSPLQWVMAQLTGGLWGPLRPVDLPGSLA